MAVVRITLHRLHNLNKCQDDVFIRSGKYDQKKTALPVLLLLLLLFFFSIPGLPSEFYHDGTDEFGCPRQILFGVPDRICHLWLLGAGAVTVVWFLVQRESGRELTTSITSSTVALKTPKAIAIIIIIIRRRRRRRRRRDNFCIALFSGVHKVTALYNTLQHFLS